MWQELILLFASKIITELISNAGSIILNIRRKFYKGEDYENN